MTLAGFGLAFFAGVLSILSPCVLPLLPIVFGAAASEHRLAPRRWQPGWRRPLLARAFSSQRSASRSEWTQACSAQSQRLLWFSSERFSRARSSRNGSPGLRIH
jgi:hypothetical protein